METDTPQKPSRNLLLTYWPILLVAVFVIFIIAVPWLAAMAPMRNWIVGRSLKDRDLRVDTADASFGYFSPLSIDQLQINSDSKDLQVSIERLECEKSWLRLWLDLPEVGTVHLQRPQVNIVIQEKKEEEEEQKDITEPNRPQFKSVVENAAIRVRREQDSEPVIDLKDLNVTVSIVREADGNVWVIEPAVLLNRMPLTPELCNNGLQLVAPMLGNALDVSGSVSLDLRRFRVPLDLEKEEKAQQIEIEGMVELHDVDAALKNPVVQASAGLIAKLLKVKLPDEISVLNNSQVAFSVREGRVHHQGLVFVFADLSSDLRMETSGSVGLDETLDLTLTARIPSELLGEGPIARRLAGGPLTLHVRGTIDEPKISLPAQQNWLAELGDALLAPDSDQREERLPGALINALEGFLSERPEQGQPKPGLFNRIKKRRNREAERDSP